MQRDIESGPPPRRSEVRAGRSVIAVVGIDRYAEWPQLDNAVSDASGAARVFARLGFVEVTAPLLDEAATGDAMRRLATDDLAHLSSDDSLVLFFAGHGHTQTGQFGDMSVKTGCVIPVDASRPRGHVSSSWLRLDTWLSDIARLPPRHILVIVDACHSGVSLGALHKWRDEGPEPTMELAALQARRSRRIITSALDDQRAMDGGPYPGHSLFTGCMIEALSGGLAGAGQRVATGRELGQYVQQRVRSYPPSTQTPDFGTFELDDRGDIVVPLGLDESSPEAVAPLTLGTSSSQVRADPQYRARIGLWIAVGCVASALSVGFMLLVTGNDRTSAPSVASRDTRDAGSSASSTLTVVPAEPATAVTATDPDAAVADAPLLPVHPESHRKESSASRSLERHHKPSPPDKKPTASTPAEPPPATPDTSQGSANPPAPVEPTAGSVPSAATCSKAKFAAVYEAEAPSRSAVQAALRDLKACRDARAISDTDFERYQTALVARL